MLVSQAEHTEIPCLVADCGKPAALKKNGSFREGGYCYACARQRHRTGGTQRNVIRQSYETPFERLMESGIVLTELRCTDDEGWERSRDRMRKAALGYALSLGWKPPPGRGEDA
jgi:hypothetical protein